jgi:hypothetical protein
MRHLFSTLRITSFTKPAVLLGLVSLLVQASGPAAAAAVLTKSGTLYEVFPAMYGDIVPGGRSDMPILALRTTVSGGQPVLQIVDGTVDDNEESSESLAFDEATNTLFVVYMKSQGIMTDVRVALRQGDTWQDQPIAPTAGLYLSMNPRLLVTRQTYLDWDGNGGKVQKSRSILTIVWWEEGGLSQARFAAVFVEDGVLQRDEILPFNLNEVAGFAGQTDNSNLPFSSYINPSLQRDLTSNGGAFVSFANLVTKRHTVLRIGFPDDLTKLSPPNTPAAGRTAYARGHLPIGRAVSDTNLPEVIQTYATVNTLIAPSGKPTFYWNDGPIVKFLRGDFQPNEAPRSIPLRPDFSAERAVGVVRDLVERGD